MLPRWTDGAAVPEPLLIVKFEFVTVISTLAVAPKPPIVSVLTAAPLATTRGLLPPAPLIAPPIVRLAPTRLKV